MPYGIIKRRKAEEAKKAMSREKRWQLSVMWEKAEEESSEELTKVLCVKYHSTNAGMCRRFE